MPSLAYKQYVIDAEAEFLPARSRWQPVLKITSAQDAHPCGELLEIPLVFATQKQAQDFANQMGRRLIDVHGDELCSKLIDEVY